VLDAKALVAEWCMGAKVMPGWYQGGGGTMLNGINTARSAVTLMMGRRWIALSISTDQRSQWPCNSITTADQHQLARDTVAVVQSRLKHSSNAAQTLLKGGHEGHHHQHSTKTHPPPMALDPQINHNHVSIGHSAIRQSP